MTGTRPALAEWLAAREPAPPPALRDRVAVFAAAVDASDDPTAALLAAAERALERLVRQPSDRGAALDLLAVDALVTYAFEAAARVPSTIPAWSAGAMARLSAVAAP